MPQEVTAVTLWKHGHLYIYLHKANPPHIYYQSHSAQPAKTGDIMNTLSQWAEQLEGLPGYDYAVDWINDKAGEKYQTKDPFYVDVKGKRKRRKAPESCSKQEKKAWKRIQKRAWFDDKNFFGCFPINLGIGMAPLLALLPVVGPLFMFAIHGRLVTIADQHFHLPAKLVAKMHANILFDLVISLPPILGSLFAWLNGCSTRNAALVHTFIVQQEMKKGTGPGQLNTGDDMITSGHQQTPTYPPQAYAHPTQQTSNPPNGDIV